MEVFDQETAARVWQRVQRREGFAEPETGQEDPVSLMLQSHALAGLYLGMQRRFTGAGAERIRRLYRQHRETIACLKGLCRLSGTAPGLPPMEAGSGDTADRLRSCAHRERRLGAAFARLAAEGEFAQVYAQLSRQAGERCREVLQLLGELEK